mmetsp:Transcript_7340/g.21675  ORF Transcript_7340/g.21675 Transcript_7340/m.21675 type:complete len:280 (+) Transcript_7340:1847-2686(+)
MPPRDRLRSLVTQAGRWPFGLTSCCCCCCFVIAVVLYLLWSIRLGGWHCCGRHCSCRSGRVYLGIADNIGSRAWLTTVTVDDGHSRVMCRGATTSMCSDVGTTNSATTTITAPGSGGSSIASCAAACFMVRACGRSSRCNGRSGGRCCCVAVGFVVSRHGRAPFEVAGSRADGTTAQILTALQSLYSADGTSVVRAAASAVSFAASSVSGGAKGCTTRLAPTAGFGSGCAAGTGCCVVCADGRGLTAGRCIDPGSRRLRDLGDGVQQSLPGVAREAHPG